MVARPSITVPFVFSLLVSGCMAKEPTKATGEPAEWPVRTFQVGRGFEIMPSLLSAPDPFSSTSALPSLPSLKLLPAVDAPESELIENVRHNTDVLLKGDLLGGYRFPVGSAFLYDAGTGTLAARTTTDGMVILESLSDAMRSRVTAYLVFDFQIFQADAVTVRRMLKETEGKAEAVAQLTQLTKLVEEGKAKDLGSFRLETRSGQLAKLESTSEHSTGSGFTLDEKGQLEVNNETRPIGWRVDVDPVLGPDGDVVDFNYELEYRFAPPVDRLIAVGQAPKLGRIEVPVANFRVANIKTTTTSLSGMARLVGVWRPFGTPELDGADVLQIAFVRTDVVRNLLPENTTLAARLKTVMDRACPISIKPDAPSEKSRNGMQTRRFKVTPDFFSSADEVRNSPQAAPDPFAAASFQSDPSGVATAIRPKCRLAIDVLKEHGVAFPEGSSAVFNSGLGMVEVTNTKENLDHADAVIQTLGKHRDNTISLTTHILQAEGDVMRQLVKETTGIADHTEVWKKAEALVAQGKAKILSTQHVETRSGQRCTIEAVEEHRYVASFTKNEAGQLTGVYEMRPVGVRLEVDSVLGPDGSTIDLNLAPEYHHAPPTFPVATPQTGGSAFQVQTSIPTFHASKLTTAITMSSGMTRLLGVWKPEGTPEFDKGDILQAAFIKADVVRIERE